jgi:hypothetical protein
MKRERRLAVIVAVVILTGTLAGVFLAPRITPPTVLMPVASDPRLSGAEEMRKQTVSARIWKNETFAFVQELGRKPGETMADPISVRVDREGAVYVLDWGARCVRKFSAHGDQVAVYGGQLGRGPGEFTNLTDADVEPDGTVWACDPVNGLVTIFNANGKVRSTMRTDRPPHRLALLGNGDFIMMPSPAGRFLFHRYDGHGVLADTCGTVVRDQERLSVILDGRCAGSRDGRFAYAGYRSGILALFDLHRKPPLFFAQTLEHPGLPQVLAQQTGEFQLVRVHPDAPMVSRSVSLVGNDVHVLSGSLSPNRKGVMDVYEHDTGKYSHSYELPALVASAYRTEGMLYAVADTTVCLWRVNSNEHMQAGLR